MLRKPLRRLYAALLVFGFGLALPLGSEQARSQTQHPGWIPLGALPKVLSPKNPNYPKLFRGGRTVNFFVDGTQLTNLLSRNLSTACARGRFNQRRNKKYVVWIRMPDGNNRRFGFADYTGFNLYDPDNRKGPGQAYLFELDGTSECRVFVTVTEW